MTSENASETMTVYELRYNIEPNLMKDLDSDAFSLQKGVRGVGTGFNVYSPITRDYSASVLKPRTGKVGRSCGRV
jgi:hypothetical protein